MFSSWSAVTTIERPLRSGRVRVTPRQTVRPSGYTICDVKSSPNAIFPSGLARSMCPPPRVSAMLPGSVRWGAGAVGAAVLRWRIATATTAMNTTTNTAMPSRAFFCQDIEWIYPSDYSGLV